MAEVGVAEGHEVSGSLVRSHGKPVADPRSQPLPGECTNHLRAKRYPPIKDPTATGAGSEKIWFNTVVQVRVYTNDCQAGNIPKEDPKIPHQNCKIAKITKITCCDIWETNRKVLC